VTVRFLFRPPAESAGELLTLPWHLPLAAWSDARLIQVPNPGLHRHVVRFVQLEDDVYALKELSERLARREYDILRSLADLGLPAVQVLGVAVGRQDLDAVLVTHFLPYSTPYRSLFATPRGGWPTERLLDALVQLLVRLHLAGVFWGDCSLSNTLFRLDAGDLAAYLVDAETSERYPALSEGLRRHDVELAHERVAGELMDLEAAEAVKDFDPIAVANELVRRYDGLWHELTAEEVLPPEEQRFRIRQRVQRLNELGFDVEELELVETPEGNVLKVRTRVAEPGNARRELLALTGLAVQENQARRLLNDIASYRAHLERKTGKPVTKALAASQWLTEIYKKVVDAIPPSLRGRLSPAEVFHEVLEHRWYLSEAAGLDVGTSAAAKSYLDKVLPSVPAEFSAGPPSAP
jgi:hypothetical protein